MLSHQSKENSKTEYCSITPPSGGEGGGRNFRISVIMGIYNCANTLVEALDSLYAQTCQDFKIILCEDGSMDNTYQVAADYAARHDNIVLIRNERNMGLNHTLNRCLELADTEYVARMDGDDISFPSRFEKEINFLDKHPEYAIVSTPMIYFDEQGEFGRGKGGYEPDKSAFIYGTPFCHAPCMVRCEAYRAVGGYSENPKLVRHEDYNLWMKMFAHGYRGYMLDEYLYAMRDDRNATHRRNLKGRLNGIYAHFLAHQTLGLPWIKFVLFAVTNLAKGLMPAAMYEHYHKKRFKQ